LADGRKESGVVFAPDALIKPGFETEICVELCAPLSGQIDTARARRAVARCFPAFEIIGTRVDAIADMALAIADNSQQKAFVLGEPVAFAGDLQLAEVEASVAINGQEVAHGRGDAVLGDPLNSVIWLAGKLAGRGLSLRAGDLIMTGSLVRQFPLKPGDRVRAAFDGIGVVEVGVAP
jgi:2-keto-4-pentenoate hydratase